MTKAPKGKAPRADDKLQTMIDRPHATPEVHHKAYDTLLRLHDQGLLPPVPDGCGDPVTDYVNMLGIELTK